MLGIKSGRDSKDNNVYLNNKKEVRRQKAVVEN